MPVQTGMMGDDEAEALLADADREAGSEAPPAEIAGADALVVEDEDASRYVDVRGRRFNLIEGEVPGMLLTKLSNAQVAAQRSPKSQEKQMEAMAAVHDSIVKLVVEDERAEFEDHCMSVSPPLGLQELMKVMGEMMEKVTNRHFQPSSASGPT